MCRAECGCSSRYPGWRSCRQPGSCDSCDSCEPLQLPLRLALPAAARTAVRKPGCAGGVRQLSVSCWGRPGCWLPLCLPAPLTDTDRRNWVQSYLQSSPHHTTSKLPTNIYSFSLVHLCLYYTLQSFELLSDIFFIFFCQCSNQCVGSVRVARPGRAREDARQTRLFRCCVWLAKLRGSLHRAPATVCTYDLRCAARQPSAPGRARPANTAGLPQILSTRSAALRPQLHGTHFFQQLTVSAIVRR